MGNRGRTIGLLALTALLLSTFLVGQVSAQDTFEPPCPDGWTDTSVSEHLRFCKNPTTDETVSLAEAYEIAGTSVPSASLPDRCPEGWTDTSVGGLWICSHPDFSSHPGEEAHELAGTNNNEEVSGSTPASPQADIPRDPSECPNGGGWGWARNGDYIYQCYGDLAWTPYCSVTIPSYEGYLGGCVESGGTVLHHIRPTMCPNDGWYDIGRIHVKKIPKDENGYFHHTYKKEYRDKCGKVPR